MSAGTLTANPGGVDSTKSRVRFVFGCCRRAGSFFTKPPPGIIVGGVACVTEGVGGIGDGRGVRGVARDK